MSDSMIGVFQEVNKRRQNEKMQITPLVMFAESWNHQQQKIDAVLKKISVFECQTSDDKRLFMNDFLVDIKELLK